jgi:hypothetical protein
MPRQHERVTVSLEAVLEFGTAKTNARVSDISRGGCFFDTLINATEGDEMIFSLKGPDGEWMRLSGTVVHYFPRIGFGLRFLPLTDAQRNFVFRIIFSQGGKLTGYVDNNGNQ